MAVINFIGTGSGKTSLKRFHSSFLISTGNFNLLVDAGDGVAKALLSQNINFDSIDGIVFSHLHPDHYTGLGVLIVQMKMQKRTKPLNIYADESITGTLKNFLISSYLFPGRMDFEILYHGFVQDENFKVSSDIQFIARQNSHLSEISKLEEYRQQSFSCSSFLFDVNGRKIHYTGDIGNADDLLLFKDYNYDYLITEVTHITFEELFSAVKSKISPRQIILTHLSDEDIPLLERQLKSLPAGFTGRFKIAEDGLKLNI